MEFSRHDEKSMFRWLKLMGSGRGGHLAGSHSGGQCDQSLLSAFRPGAGPRGGGEGEGEDAGECVRLL